MEIFLRACIFDSSVPPGFHWGPGHRYRCGASDEEISAMIASVWRSRDDRYSELRTPEITEREKVEMSYIGG